MRNSNPMRFLLTLAATALVSFSVHAGTLAENPETPPPPHEQQAPVVEKNLKIFDTLDFDVFSNQKWERLKESHSKDIVVTWRMATKQKVWKSTPKI